MAAHAEELMQPTCHGGCVPCICVLCAYAPCSHAFEYGDGMPGGACILGFHSEDLMLRLLRQRFPPVS